MGVIYSLTGSEQSMSLKDLISFREQTDTIGQRINRAGLAHQIFRDDFQSIDTNPERFSVRKEKE
jgi:hypothetical protein